MPTYLGLFAVVIGLACLAASALVTDTLLRDCGSGWRGNGPTADRS